MLICTVMFIIIQRYCLVYFSNSNIYSIVKPHYISNIAVD